MSVAKSSKTNTFFQKTKRSTKFLFAALIIIAIIAIAIGLGIYYGTRNPAKTYPGGIVSNGYESAGIGRSIISKGGSAVDAAIAALFAEGIAMPQSMGLGGGFVMTIYIRSTGEITTLNAREVAPLRASRDMFGGNSTLSQKGGLSIAVPGELMGYWHAHQKYGVLPWTDLIQPTIDLCRKGHLVTKYLAGMMKDRRSQILASETLREIYINPSTNEPYTEGEHIKRLKLADTLEIIAREGAAALYNGSLTERFVADIQRYGGIITAADMNSYRPEWQDPVSIKLPRNDTMYTFPLPSSGVILTFIMNLVKGFLDTSQINTVTNWQRILESFKYGYGRRTELGDVRYVDINNLVANLTSEVYAVGVRSDISDNKTYQDPTHYGANFSQVEDHGTAHLNVIAPNGDAVAVTSTINYYFGSDIISPSTGIILNDEMDDFSSPNIISGFNIPPSPANYIEPGKRPLSSMCPTIIVDSNGDVKFTVGAAGGTKITTSTALVTIRHLWFNNTVSEAVNASRIHHQLFPMNADFEYGFPENIIEGLRGIGHVCNSVQSTGFSAVTALARLPDMSVVGATDPRRPGGQVVIF